MVVYDRSGRSWFRKRKRGKVAQTPARALKPAPATEAAPAEAVEAEAIKAEAEARE